MRFFHGEGGQDQKGKYKKFLYTILLTPLYENIGSFKIQSLHVKSLLKKP